MFFKKKDKFKDSSSSIDFAIIGLGNPGIDYQNTRHNAGFICIDYIADTLGVSINKLKHKAYYAQAEFGGKKVLLIKPQTFMNNSGEAVVPLLKFFKLDYKKAVVICDDISLDVGKIRIRRKGSDGGQKGLRSIIDLIGSEDIARIKVGVGNKPNPNYDLAKWVLSKFKPDEQESLKTVAKNVCGAAKLIVNGEIDKAMNNYNS